VNVRFLEFLIVPLFLLMATMPGHAMLTVQAAAVDATNPSNFLLAAEAANGDPAHDRESVNARFQVQLINANAVFPDEIEVEATFSLADQTTGLPVVLTSGGTSITQTQLFSLAAQQQQIEVMDAALEPAAMLDPEVNHRVVASVRYRSNSGVWSAPVIYNGTWRKWVHFINTTADDDSLNVKPVAGTLSVTDSQILKSVAGEEAFKATLGMKLYRYDIDSAPQPAVDVTVRFDLILYDIVTLAEVPLEHPSIIVTRPMVAMSENSPPDPVTDLWTQEISFAPAAGEVLDPTAAYALKVTVNALEPDTTPVPSVPPVKEAASGRFLVLSGKLWFGGVETIFTQLANDPSLPMILTPPDVYSTQLAVAEGSAPAAPGRRFGNGAPLDVNYDPVSGDATVAAGAQQLETTASDIVTLGGLRVVRGVIRLDATGSLLESGGVIFPAGFGISTSQNSLRHQPGLDLGQVALNNDFTIPFASKPVNAPAGQYFYAFCDRLPLRFRTSVITWNVNAGTFEFFQTATSDPADPAEPVLTRSFQEQELAALAPLLADSDAANRPGNDAFLKNITSTTPVTIATGAQGEAVLTVQFDLGPGQMQTHFPQGVAVSWTSGRFTLDQNVITGPNYLETGAPLTVSYRRDCNVAGCGGVSGPGQMVFAPTDDRLYITPDGGLRAEGGITPERLRWGTTELLGGGSPPEGGYPYAHQTSQWQAGAFHAPGFWLAGTVAMPVSDPQRPQSLLFSGVMGDGSYERPLTQGYRDGFADYAGLNLRVLTAGSKTGRSVLAGTSTPDYDLNARSKYYIRAGGVTGIHEAQAFPSNLVMYDFPVVFDGLRLAFRDGENVESKTGGAIHVKSPVEPLPGFDLDFKEMKFLCRGQPGKMKLATEGEAKSLAYWGTDFTPLSMEFFQPTLSGGCMSVTTGFLRVGAQTRFPSITPQKLHATLGFKGANGNLITKADQLDVDSRFTLPPNIQVLGAGGVPWEITITGSAYLNNPAPLAAANYSRPDNGFLTFPATINVPWFEDIKVQFHVSASSSATTASIFHVMGGWPANPADPNVHGWQEGGQTYFTDKFFDGDHVAFPTGPAGMTVATYRSPASEPYNPRAQKRWLGVVDFDFPLEWEPTQRRFRTSQAEIDELLVLGNVHRQLRSLTPSTAELTFGLELDIPRVNTAALTAAVKEGVSNTVADALTSALTQGLRDEIGSGISSLDALLSERVNEVWDLPLNNAADPLADAVLAGASTASQRATLLNSLAGLNLDQEISSRMQSGRSAVSGALAIVGTSGGRPNVGALVKRLLQGSSISEVASLGEAAVDSALAEVLPQIEPDLQQAQEALARAHAALESAEAKVLTQVAAVIPQNQTALENAADLALMDINTLVSRNEWQMLDATGKRDRIRRLLSERVMASSAVPQFQYIVRQHVQDTNDVFRSALDDVFGQVNQVMRAIIKREVAANVLGNDVISPAVGQMGPESGGNGKLAAINIEGYAQINDESLRVLDINGRFEFNVPDSLQVQAHLRIMEVDANTPRSGCRVAEGTTASIVTVTARAQCDWISTAGTTLEVGARFSLINGDPMGFDGYFAFSGEVSVGPVTVREMRLMAGFGTNGAPVDPKVWAYIGGKARGLYGGYESAVGVFLGRTCDIEVLKMVDPFIGQALTASRVNPLEPITGVYLYGEAWFPLNEVFGIPSTCLLTLKAGAGSGFFAFIGKREGSETDAVFIGCKQLYGVEGTVLCALRARGTMSVLGALAVNIPDLPIIGSPPEDGVVGLAKNIANSLLGGTYVLRGEGELELRFGYCPLCVDVGRRIGLRWTMSPPKATLGIDF
jgi:hypothetical protein